jgi:hypothetical protein
MAKLVYYLRKSLAVLDIIENCREPCHYGKEFHFGNSCAAEDILQLTLNPRYNLNSLCISGILKGKVE